MTNAARPLSALAVAALLSMLLVIAPQAVAQPVERPCAEETAPQDGFRSQGVGLTTSELEELYGTPEIGQGSLVFDFQGVDLHQTGCDLILAFPPDWVGGEQRHEFALAESLLPADAEYAGSFARGTTIRSEEPASLWTSASLADRFAALGEPRGGKILVLYTYDSSGFEPGPIQHVELRTLELPE
jgi:hypothetical protein